jgi:hypothetical protein
VICISWWSVEKLKLDKFFFDAMQLTKHHGTSDGSMVENEL